MVSTVNTKAAGEWDADHGGSVHVAPTAAPAPSAGPAATVVQPADW